MWPIHIFTWTLISLYLSFLFSLIALHIAISKPLISSVFAHPIICVPASFVFVNNLFSSDWKGTTDNKWRVSFESSPDPEISSAKVDHKPRDYNRGLSQIRGTRAGWVTERERESVSDPVYYVAVCSYLILVIFLWMILLSLCSSCYHISLHYSCQDINLYCIHIQLWSDISLHTFLYTY